MLGWVRGRKVLLRRGSHPSLAMFARGFVGLMPLWAGAIPAGVIYGATARATGWSVLETQAMSVLVFSASAQMSAVALAATGTPVSVIVGVALGLNAQLLLLGLAAGRALRLSRLRRLVSAWLLTDGAYAVAVRSGSLTLPDLLGAGTSMFVAWNAGTALGMGAGHLPFDLASLGLDFVVPLTFLAVLVPMLRTPAAAITALVAAATVLLCPPVVPRGIVVLIAGLAGSASGTWWSRRRGREPSPTPGGSGS